MQPRFLVKHISAIPKRVERPQRFRQFASTPQRRAPRIVAVADDGIAILIQNRNNVALQALDVGIRRAIVHRHRRTVLRVIEEVQLIRAGSHMHNILAVQRVLRRYAVDRLLNPQPVFIIHKLASVSMLRIRASCRPFSHVYCHLPSFSGLQCYARTP